MKKYLLFFLIIIGLMLPMFVWAQGILSGPIVPCGTKANPTPCTLCDIFRMMQTIITFIGAGIFVIAMIFIAVGGVITLTSAGSPDKVGQGKAMITSAIIGIIIALLSWVIINEVLIAVSGSMQGERVGRIRIGNLDWPWNRIECVGGGITEGDGAREIYCVCEYVSANSDNNIRATQISGYDDNSYTCQQLCTSSSSVSYCGSAARVGTENMYCAYASDSRISRQTACMSQVESWQRVGTTCYATLQDCNNAADNQFRSICYDADGNLQCQCNSGAPIGVTDPCTSSSQDWTLFIHGRTFISCHNNVLSCSSGIGSSCDFCKLGCPTTGGGVIIGTCSGVGCSDSGLNICGQTSNNCSISQVNNWNSQIQAAVSGRSICGGINTVAMVKAIMARESGGDISRIASDGQSAGLMQLIPATAERFKGSCGVSVTIDFSWLTNSANAEAQICIAIEFLRSLVGECGCDVRQLAAGYNGGGGRGACRQSVNCGPSAAQQGGQCLICTNESFTRAWECLWDDNTHTVCNATRTPNFSYTRQYVPQVAYCYDQF